MKIYRFLLIFTCLFMPLLISAQSDTAFSTKRKGYSQFEFTYINEYNRTLWKFLRAIDEVKGGYYESNLSWAIDASGRITSLRPDVDNSLFTGQSMLRNLNLERDNLAKAGYDEKSHRMTEVFQNALQNAQEGVDEIVRYYATAWKLQTEAQAADVQKRAGWTKVWEAMRDLVTKSRQYLNTLQDLDTPKNPYVEANVIVDQLPPVLLLPATPPGSAFMGFWYNLCSTPIVVAEPLQPGTTLMVGDVILGVYTFGSAITKTASDFNPATGAERMLVPTPSILSFSKIFNERKDLAGKTVRLLVRRDGQEVKVDVPVQAADGGNIFQR